MHSLQELTLNIMLYIDQAMESHIHFYHKYLQIFDKFILSAHVLALACLYSASYISLLPSPGSGLQLNTQYRPLPYSPWTAQPHHCPCSRESNRPTYPQLKHILGECN